MWVYHVLAPGTTAGIRCGAGSCLQRTAPTTTSFMRQVAKVSIRRTCAVLRWDNEMSLGRWTRKVLVRGMTTAGAVIKVLWWRSLVRDRLAAARYRPQRVIRLGSSRTFGRATWESGMERKAEDRGHPRASCEQRYQQCARNSPESEPGACSPVDESGAPVHGVRTLLPFDNLRNEVNAIAR